MEIKKQKKLLRQKLLNKRKKLKDKKVLDNKILTNLELLEVYQKAQVVCVYLSFNEEVSTHDLVQRLLKDPDKTVVVPKTRESLSLHVITAWEDLTSGKFGILEPRNEERFDPSQVDLFIVPGIGFSRDGGRLGWGKGYYDKLLTDSSGFILGVAYEDQFLETLSQEVHDIKMNAVVTEKRVYLI